MDDVVKEIVREIALAILGPILGLVGARVSRLVRDVNSAFAKVRDLEDRIKKLEGAKDG